jgi:hypothetical protein
VRRALGSSAIEENEQLMMEAEALAEIIGGGGTPAQRLFCKSTRGSVGKQPVRSM